MFSARTHLSRKVAIGLAALIILLGFGLRLHRLGLDSIWWDEGYAVWMARLPVQEMFFQTANDNAPPLSYLMLHYWRLLAGDEELALRLLSLFSGVLTVAASYQIGREVGGRGVGLAAMLIVAIARFTVWWSQEIRLYAHSALFAAIYILAGLRLFMEKRGVWKWSAVAGASLALGMLTVYLFGAPVVVMNVALLPALVAARRRWWLLLAWGGAQAAALLLFLPWWGYATQYIPTWATPQQSMNFGQTVLLYLGVGTLGISSNIEQYVAPISIIVLCFLTAMGASFAGASRRQRIGWGVLIISAVLSPVLIYLLSIPRGRFNAPIPSPRYFLPLITPAYVLLGWGAVAIGRKARYLGTGIVAIFVGLSLWSLGQYYAGLRLTDDYGSLVLTLEALRGENDAVLLNDDTDWPIFTYHYPYPFDRQITHTQPVGDEKYAEALLKHYRGSAGAVWLVQTPYASVTDPGNHILEWLDSKSWHTVEYDFGDIQLWYFALTQERADRSRMDQIEQHPPGLRAVNAPIADHVQLTGYAQAIPEVTAGDRLAIGLVWQTDDRIKGEWPVAVKIIGRDGREYASTSLTFKLKRGRVGEKWEIVEIFIPPDAPSGRAQIVFVAGTSWQPLGSVRIRKRPVEPTVIIPPGAANFDVRFGEDILLRSASLPDQTVWSPGDSIPITFYWQALNPIPLRYKVFVHIEGDQNNPETGNTIWGQQDQEPGGGINPTTSWLPGKTIEDSYLVTISPATPAGRYRLRVGFYLPLDDLRLQVMAEDGGLIGDSLVMLEFEVR